jgi:hypothetical protein
MLSTRLDAACALGFARRTLATQFVPLTVAGLAALLLLAVPLVTTAGLNQHHPLLATFTGLSTLALQAITILGLARISVEVRAGRPFAPADLLDGLRDTFTCLAAEFCFALLLMLRLLPLLLLALLFTLTERFWPVLADVAALLDVLILAATLGVASRYLFAPYLILVERAGPLMALRASAALTRDHRMGLFLLALLLIGLNAIGAMAALVGLALTLPASALMLADVYQQLQRAILAMPPPGDTADTPSGARDGGGI